jgi:hypothetical protein
LLLSSSGSQGRRIPLLPLGALVDPPQSSHPQTRAFTLHLYFSSTRNPCIYTLKQQHLPPRRLPSRGLIVRQWKLPAPCVVPGSKRALRSLSGCNVSGLVCRIQPSPPPFQMLTAPSLRYRRRTFTCPSLRAWFVARRPRVHHHVGGGRPRCRQ